MIIAFTGMPGSGKTLALVRRAEIAIKQGRKVFANFALKGTYKISLDDLCTYQFPEDCVVLIDEAGRWFNSREWKDLPAEIFDLFTMHRHVKMDLYIAVQSFARIDKSLREVVELVYWADNVSWKPYISYRGYYDLEKMGSMKKDWHVSQVVWKRKRLYSFYDTYSMKDKFSHKPFVKFEKWSHYEKTKQDIIKQEVRIFKKKVVRRMRSLVAQFFKKRGVAD